METEGFQSIPNICPALPHKVQQVNQSQPGVCLALNREHLLQVLQSFSRLAKLMEYLANASQRICGRPARAKGALDAQSLFIGIERLVEFAQGTIRVAD